MTQLAEWQKKSQIEVNKVFIKACQGGDLETVQYLLTNKDLKFKAEIHDNNEYALRFACANGRIDIVKYLLTSKELTDHANINADNEGALKFACMNNHTEVIKYLLTSPELKKHANFDTNYLSNINWALQKKSHELLRFYVFDLYIEYTNEIKKLLKQKPNEQLEKWFKLRDLNEKLDKNLPLKKKNKNNFKV